MPDQTPTPEPQDDVPWEAIARYFVGESTPEEIVAVRQWLEDHPADAEALSFLQDQTRRLVQATPPDLDVEAALRRVNERRDAADVIPIETRRPARRTPLRTGSTVPARRWPPFAIPAIAAAAVVGVGVTLYWHSLENDGYTSPTAAQTFATAVGKRDSVRLSDGTRVLLAPESRLTVAMGYGKKVRELELTGEAYFDVHHDAAHPFVVHAGGADIR